MKDKTRITFAVILAIIGIFFISYNQISGVLYERWLDKNQGEILSNITKESIEENQYKVANSDLFDYDAIENINAGMMPPKVNIDEINNAVGVISIPSVNLEEPILYGTTNENLWLGATTMKPDQEMGKGNYTLAGHNHHTKPLLFQPIRDVNDGDEIYVTDKDKVYTYKVTGKEVVMPERVDVLDEVPGKEMITLVSCFSKDGSDRIIVTGELFEVQDYKE